MPANVGRHIRNGVAPGTAEKVVSSKILDKYVLPKVALTVIIFASAAGVALSGLREGQTALVPLAVRWVAFLTLAAWTGTLFWRTLILHGAIGKRQTEMSVAYGVSQIERFRRLENFVVPVLLATAALNLIISAGTPGAAAASHLPGWAKAAAVCILGALSALHVLRPAAPTDWAGIAGERVRAALLLVICFGLLAVNSAVEVALQEPTLTVPLAINRWFHLAAFSVWFGGAIWNIFIAVPTGRDRLHLDTIIAANAQLEGFRWTVRFILPTIILTGLIQAYHIVGFSLTALTGTELGWFILFKAGTIIALIAIFITCPMWRACSPVAGVCNLDDIVGE